MSYPKSDLTRTTLAVLFIGFLIVASLWTVWPFVSAAVWAVMIVIATWPILLWVQSRLWNSRRAAVGVMAMALLLLLVLPLLASIVSIVDNADEVAAWAVSVRMPPAPEFLSRIPFIGVELARAWNSLLAPDVSDLASRFMPHIVEGARWLLSTVGGVGNIALQLILTVIIATLLYANGEMAARGLRLFGERLAGDRGVMSVTLAGQAIRGVALGVVVTAIVQALLAAVGLSIAGVPHVPLLTVFTFILCVAQIGPILVLVPAAIWLFWIGDSTPGIFLLAWSIPVVVLDNVLRAFLIKKKGADLPLALIFLGVLGGLLGFGLIGMFVGPVVLAVTYKLLVAWVAESRPP